MRRLIRILFTVIAIAFVLYIGGTTYLKLADDIHLRNPVEVLSKLFDNMKFNLPSVDDTITIPNSTTIENQLNELVKKIRVSTENKTDMYDRAVFERPVKSYEFEGRKVSRNEYAWRTSQYLINVDPFQYKCPYTGDTITDKSSLDFDHIIALGYIHKYGNVAEWSDEKKNEYAYDQSIGVNVLNFANRSKSDKAPSEWLPKENIANYCYTWLQIAERYDIALRQVDIDVCVEKCNEAIAAGKTLEIID